MASFSPRQALLNDESADGAVAVLGRSGSCEVKLGLDEYISRRHVQLEARVHFGGRLFVRDLGSEHCTYLNGNRCGRAHHSRS